MKIIITRPEPFASQLAEKLNAAGFAETICLPCLRIESSSSTLSPNSSPASGRGEMVIFISRNAVLHGHALIQDQTIAAIGLGTKTELERHGKSVDIFPTQPPFDSEALLTLPALLNVKHKNITIIRGGEGRDLLFDTLSTRGATVCYLDVYTRLQPDYPLETLQAVFSKPEQKLAICTSEDLLQNLCRLAEKSKMDITGLQLCVISPKMVKLAKTAGFSKPAILANSPRDEDILWTIQSRKT